MNANKLSFTNRVLLVPDRQEPAIRIAARQFRRFGASMDTQLEGLVARYQGNATVCSVERSSGRR